MKTKKPKRISALKSEEYLDGKKPVKCYLLRQSDIRALAEQMCQDNLNCGLSWENSMLYALRRAGMTPGKARAK